MYRKTPKDVGRLAPGGPAVHFAGYFEAIAADLKRLFEEAAINPALRTVRALAEFPVTVTGTVEDGDNDPVAGATIELTLWDTAPILVYSATSDAAGQFSIPGVWPGNYAQLTKATGFLDQATELVVEDPPAPVAIELMPVGGGD